MPDDPNATPMPTDPNAADAPAGAQPASAPAKADDAPERKFSQAEVDAIVGERLRREREARGRTENPKPERQTKATEAERLDRIETEHAFYRGLSRTGVTLTEDQESDLLDLYRVHKPERPGEWLAERVKRFGLGAKEAPATTTTPTNPAQPATPEPRRGAPTAPNRVDPLTSGSLVDVSKLTSEEILKLGPGGVRQQLERVIETGQAAQGRPQIPSVLRRK